MLQGICDRFRASVLGIVANFCPGRMAPSGGTSSSQCGDQLVWGLGAAPERYLRGRADMPFPIPHPLVLFPQYVYNTLSAWKH
jgi:hypothetical protein